MMKAFLLAAALLGMALPGAEAKLWSDEECSRTLEYVQGRGFILKGTEQGAQPLACEIVNWPVESRTGTLRCADGSQHKIEFIGKATMTFDGQVMRLPTDENGICRPNAMKRAVAKVWTDQDCRRKLEYAAGTGYTLTKSSQEGAPLSCEIASWPAESPVGILRCADGSEHQIEFIGNATMRLDGEVMRVPSDENRVCH